MALHQNFGNFLPHNEARNFILDPAATGIDDHGDIVSLDFIADISISCKPSDDPYLSSFNIGKELVSGIVMSKGKPLLAFTVLKKDWKYGRTVFLTDIAGGYSGYVTPGRLNTVDEPIVRRFSSPNQSRLAERCLFRFEAPITEVTDGQRSLRGVVRLEGLEGLRLAVDGKKILFLLDEQYQQEMANGINRFDQYQTDISHNVGGVGGAYPDEFGVLDIVLNGPFTVVEIKEEEDGPTIGVELGLDVSMEDLCGDPFPPRPPQGGDHETDCDMLEPEPPHCEDGPFDHPDRVDGPGTIVVPPRPPISADCSDPNLRASLVGMGTQVWTSPRFSCRQITGELRPFQMTLTPGSIERLSDTVYRTVPGWFTPACVSLVERTTGQLAERTGVSVTFTPQENQTLTDGGTLTLESAFRITYRLTLATGATQTVTETTPPIRLRVRTVRCGTTFKFLEL